MVLVCLQVAGSAEQFKKVDYEWVAASAELAKKGGVRHYRCVCVDVGGALQVGDGRRCLLYCSLMHAVPQLFGLVQLGLTGVTL